MFNITGGEIIIVLVLALVVLGPDKLPGFIRSAGRLYSEMRKMASGFKAEFDEAMAEPLREMRDTADMAKRWFDSPDDDEEGLVVDDGSDLVTEDGDDEIDPFAPDGDDTDGDDTDGDEIGDDTGDDDEFDADAISDAETDDDDDDDEDDDGDDPNFYDENGNLLDAAAISALIDDAEREGGPDGSGAGAART